MKLSTKNFLTKLNKDIFTISMVSFVALFFLEMIKPKFVIAYINLNYVLLLCLVTGIFTVLVEEEKPAESLTEKNKISKNMLVAMSVIVFVFIMFFTYDLGIWGALIGFVGAFVAFLLGLTLG